jgi:hypothetical protein
VIRAKFSDFFQKLTRVLGSSLFLSMLPHAIGWSLCPAAPAVAVQQEDAAAAFLRHLCESLGPSICLPAALRVISTAVETFFNHFTSGRSP